MGPFKRRVKPSTQPGRGADARDLAVVVPLVRVDLIREASSSDSRPEGIIASGDPSAPLIDHLIGSLIVLYAFDRGDHFQMVSHGDLARLGVDQAVVTAAAHTNLIERMADLQLLERPDGCGMVRLDGNLESSVLLVPTLWQDIAGIVGDEVVIAVPARDVVLWSGAGNEAVMGSLRAARDRVLAVGDHQITKDLFRFVPDLTDRGDPADPATWWRVEPR